MFILYFVFQKRCFLEVYDHFHLRSNPLIPKGGFYPIAIHKKLLIAISPKIGNFAGAIKSLRDHVCASADAIARVKRRGLNVTI